MVFEDVSSNSSFGAAQFDFSRTGTLAYRNGATEGLRTLQWLDGNGKSVSLGLEPALYNVPRLSPDGSRLTYMVNQGADTDLWVYELLRGNKTRLTSGGYNSFPIWSPDGQFLVFQSSAGMFSTRADGAGKPQPLMQGRVTQIPTSWNSDGEHLVFSELTDGGFEIRTVTIENRSGQLHAGEPRLFLKTATVNTFAAFSPDGRWLAYSDSEAGSYEVWVRSFPDNGAKVQISNAGGILPVWSRNGRELFYRTENQRIMVANYTVKGGTFVAEKPRLWPVTSAQLDSARAASPSHRVFNPAPRRRRCWPAKRLANVGVAVNFDPASDGKRFVVEMPAEARERQASQNHVMLVVNFLDEVRRRLAGQGR
jgi:serine/threonine-protein kinase